MRLLTFCAGLLLFTPLPCRAQDIPPWEARRWEFEVHAGGGLANDPSLGGTSSLPAAGAPFTTTVGTPSRQVPSWYFGDGAALLNQVNAALGAGASIVPLDPVLGSSIISWPSGKTAGFRLGRTISRRLGAEFTLDYDFAKWQLSAPALAGTEATRASFATALNALIATGPFNAPTVTSVTTVTDHQGQQVFATGAININLRSTGNLLPYATAGAGVNVNVGSTPTFSLTGNYRFQVLGLYPIAERDTTTVQSSVESKVVGVVGGGLKYYFSRRLGARFDVRAYVSRRAAGTVITARPSTATNTQPQIATATFTTPSVQFSNNSAVGQSSLGGASNGFSTFDGSGTQSVVHVTGGLILRFR